MTQQNPQLTDWPPKKVVCVGAVVLQETRVLFIRQAKGASAAGQWSIPWGFVDPNEAPEAAALRETLEEGGVTAELVGLLGFQNLPRDMLGLIFLCHHLSGTPTHDGGLETDAAAYFSLADLNTCHEPILPFCEWIARRVLQNEHRVIPPVIENPYASSLAFL